MLKFLLIVLLLFSQSLRAEDSIKFLVGFAPGGGQHIVTTIISNAASKAGIDNRIMYKEGAGGIIGMNECVALASKDTLCMATQAQYAHSITLDPSIRRYDPEKLTYVKAIGISPTVLITHSSNKKPLDKVLDDIKNQKLSFGSGALGLSLLTDWFLKELGAKDTVIAEFRGTGPVLTNILGKQIDFAILPYTVVKAAHNQGQIRIVATLGHTEELSKLGIPMLPTMSEMDDNYTIFGFVMAPNIDREIVKKYEEMITKLIASPFVKDQLVEQGIFPLGKNLQNLSFYEISKSERIKITKQLAARSKP